MVPLASVQKEAVYVTLVLEARSNLILDQNSDWVGKSGHPQI